MRSFRWLYAYMLGTALLAVHKAPARADLYEFTIQSAASSPGRAVGIGDPGRSQALRFASGDILVSVPLASLVVEPGGRPAFDAPSPGYLNVFAPAPGVTLASPAPGFHIDLGGGPPDPACIAGTLACVTPLSYASVSLVGLPVDIWGRFQTRAGAPDEVWVPNPNPGVRFTALPALGVQGGFPGLFSMRPLVPEPSIALLFAIGMGAAWTARRRNTARPCPKACTN